MYAKYTLASPAQCNLSAQDFDNFNVIIIATTLVCFLFLLCREARQTIDLGGNAFKLLLASNPYQAYVVLIGFDLTIVTKKHFGSKQRNNVRIEILL